jgi:hypothetical protein
MKSVLLRALSLLILLPTLYYLGTFPVAQIPLFVGACGYFGLLLWRPNLWLFAVPLLLPLLYLTPWSGRIFFDEFDALVLVTIATALWNGRYTFSVKSFSSGTGLLLFLFIAVYIAALLKGLLPLPEFDANATATYYSSLNSLRSAKGLLWALLLYPAWTAERLENPPSAKQLFLTGLAAGAVCVFLAVLWEREVFYALFSWSDEYPLRKALFNFTTQYRVTALFADMHTGGTAIDSYLLLTLPFTAVVLFRAKSLTAATFGGIALFGILYACIVTFSRGVYLGLAVVVLSSAFLLLYQNRNKLRFSIVATLLIAVIVLAAACFLAFRSGGFTTVVYTAVAFLSAAILSQFKQHLGTKYFYGGLALLCLLFITLATAVVSAKDYAFNSAPSVLIASASILPGVMAGNLAGTRFRLFLSLRQAGAVLVTIPILVALLVPSLFGYRMNTRFSSVKDDLLHRIEHWGTAANIMDRDLLTTIFGQGLGRFPATYLWRHQDQTNVGQFSFRQEQNNQFLRYSGAKDVRLGQRISLQPNTDYVVSLDIRTKDKLVYPYLRICHRQLIHPTEWNPLCVQIGKKTKSTMGLWKRLTFPINTGAVGSWKNGLRAPLVFSISNRREYALELRPQTILDFDNISIRSTDGSELLINGDFESGIDRWFGYYDFNHLPWHIKNLLVHAYFELGAAGLLFFALLILAALINTARTAPHNGFAFALFVSLLGFLAVGGFGTLIDSPRIAFLFYLVLLVSLELGGKSSGSKRQEFNQRPQDKISTNV